jgi:hypothetical protein
VGVTSTPAWATTMAYCHRRPFFDPRRDGMMSVAEGNSSGCDQHPCMGNSSGCYQHPCLGNDLPAKAAWLVPPPRESRGQQPVDLYTSVPD